MRDSERFLVQYETARQALSKAPSATERDAWQKIMSGWRTLFEEAERREDAGQAQDAGPIVVPAALTTGTDADQACSGDEVRAGEAEYGPEAAI